MSAPISKGVRHPATYKMSHVQAEIEYLRNAVEEQKAIIDQLVNGPGEVEYIHPYDLQELISKHDLTHLAFTGMMCSSPDSADIVLGPWPGKRYRQSALIPVRTKSVR